jgi:hypothetical protein
MTTWSCMCTAVCAVVVALASSASLAADFNFERDCAQWIDQKGFSTDYIKLKTGKRQRGMADGWRGNVASRDVRAGDVAMTYIKEKGRRMRASYVEEVVRIDANGSAGAVIVTEWNEGKYIDEPCFVTDHFGRDSGRRTIAVETIVRVWRPSLPLSAAAPE